MKQSRSKADLTEIRKRNSIETHSTAVNQQKGESKSGNADNKQIYDFIQLKLHCLFVFYFSRLHHQTTNQSTSLGKHRKGKKKRTSSKSNAKKLRNEQEQDTRSGIVCAYTEIQSEGLRKSTCTGWVGGWRGKGSIGINNGQRNAREVERK